MMKLPKTISYGDKENIWFFRIIGVSRLVDSERCLWALGETRSLAPSPLSMMVSRGGPGFGLACGGLRGKVRQG